MVTHQPRYRCIDFVESITDWMEDALDEDERLALEEHLVVCADCTEYLAQLRLTTTVLRHLRDHQRLTAPPPSAAEALLAAFRQRRRDDLS